MLGGILERRARAQQQGCIRFDAPAGQAVLPLLRGACGAVGAVALQDQAQALERALVEARGAPGAQCAAGCQALRGDASALDRTLQTLAAEIRARLPA